MTLAHTSTRTQPDPDITSPAALVALLDHVQGMTEAAGRQDLTMRIRTAKARARDPRMRVVLVGEPKQGKSMLLNTLLNAEVCAVGEMTNSAVPVLVSYGVQPRARKVVRGRGGYEALEIDPERVHEAARQTRDEASGREVVRVEVELPRALLRDGLMLVDTPGVGSSFSVHAASTLSILPSADAAVFVTDASQEFTAPELAFLHQVRQMCPTVICAITKTDLYAAPAVIVGTDRKHLDDNGLVELPLLPTSSTLRAHANRTGDAQVDSESGFPALVTALRRNILARGELLVRRSVASDVRAVVDHLSMSWRSEIEALQNPAEGGAVVARLRDTQAAADQLRRGTAHWQITLADHMGDLASDIDHDLRDRLRKVLDEADEVIDSVDPGQNWDKISTWLRDGVADAVGANFVWAHQRAVWVVGRVAQEFGRTDGAELPELDDIATTDGLLDTVKSVPGIDDGVLGLGEKVLMGMRGSYGGVLMFGLITTLMGMTLINPVSIGAGIVIGTKAYRDEQKARLKARRAEAKSAVRTHLDDVVFQVGKESRDRLRHVQQAVRDHFADLAEELTRSATESLQRAQQAVQLDADQRQEALQRNSVALDQLRQIRLHADRISATVPPLS